MCVYMYAYERCVHFVSSCENYVQDWVGVDVCTHDCVVSKCLELGSPPHAILFYCCMLSEEREGLVHFDHVLDMVIN